LNNIPSKKGTIYVGKNLEHDDKNHNKLINMKIFIVLTIFTGIFCWFGYSVYVLNQASIYAENGLLENIQVFTLISSCLVFLLPVLHQKREDKLVLLFFSFLCFSFILREIDVEHFDIPIFLKTVGSGIGRNIMLAVGFIAMTTYALLNFTYYKILARVFLVSIEGLLIIMAGILLYIGDYFEHYKLIQHHVFLEEIFELSGYVLILLAALILSKKKLSHINSNELT